MTTTYQEAFARHQQATRAALTFEDRDLSAAALFRRRGEMHARANADLAQVIPPVPSIPGPSRAEILDGIRPTTADSLAAAAREREKVQALMGAGRRLDQILAGASPVRVGAILDSLETLPEVLESREGDAIVAEFEALAFNRLASLGHEPAVSRVRAEAAAALPAAWNRILTEVQVGEVSTRAWTALFLTDPEAYREAQAAAIPGLGAEVARFERQQEQAREGAPVPAA